MRPLELEIEGFTCYRERQPVLDLREMRLFAISGPTGAGKSSLLDAMLFALYGKVPRVDGKRGLGAADLISHGRDVLSVRLDFQVRGRTYRVVRRLKQRKAQAVCTPILEELTATGARAIADSVTGVDAALAELLGLDFDGFTRTVVLPQNEFAAFLRSKARDRREILQQLLRHSVYEAMRAEAAERHKLLDRDLKGKREQLDQLGAATPETLAEIDERLEAARAVVEAAAKEETCSADQLRDVARRRELTQELSTRREATAALEARKADITSKEREVDLARRAAVVVPAIEAAARAAERSRKARGELDEARRLASALASRHETATAALAAAERAAAEIEPLRAAISTLDEIRGDVERRPRLEQALAASRTAAAEASARLEQESRQEALAAKAGADAASALATCEAALAATAYDEPRHHALDGGRDHATRGRALASEVEALRARRADLRGEQAAASAEVVAARSAHADAQAAWDAAVVALAEADRAVRHGRDAHAAEALRQRLVAGQECPVCRQAVGTVPLGGEMRKLESLEDAAARAKQVEERARKALDVTARALAAAEAHLTGVTRNADAVSCEFAGKTSDYRACVAALDALLGPAETAGERDHLRTFDSALGALQAAAREFQERRQATHEAERRSADAAVTVARAQARVREAEILLKKHRDEVARLVMDVDAVAARIAAATSAPDPAAERARLARRVADLDAALAAARQAVARVAQDLAAATGGAASLEGTVRGAVEEQGQRDAAVQDALEQARFATADEASTSARPRVRVDALERETRDYREELTAVAQRVAALTREIGGREVDAAAHAAALAAHSSARDRHRAARDAVTRMEEQREQLRGKVELAGRLGEAVRQLTSRLSVAQQMAQDLRSDGFQDYLLEETFRRIVAGASTRLFDMSRRYTMEWVEGDFHVVDHDNAGERRPAETLSGGETFMASLCLALQLSEEVLHASGALQMDSLFIDEGFGTLDSQALSEVADALETLGADGGRLIGVISHRQELTLRLPGVIRVEKGSGESTWVVERAG